MSKPKLLVTHALFEGPRQRLDEAFEVEFWTASDRPSRSEFLRRVADKDALICLLTEKIDDELLDAAPNLRIAANVAVGFDNIDLDACTRHKVAASNTPGVLDETTADFAWTLMLAAARRLIEGDALARSGNWNGWNLDQLCGADVWGKTLGVFGLGRIGQAVARRAQGFGMRIVYNDAKRAPAEVETRLHAEYLDRDSVLAQADFLTLHVPLLPETRHLIGDAELAKMKRTAFLINTSRGPVVNEAALVAALENKTIAGAALDVYEHEPQIAHGLLRPNVVLAPHLASASVETRTKMAMMAAENVIALFQGRRPPNLLNAAALEGAQLEGGNSG
jgi:glyoxylate reductase